VVAYPRLKLGGIYNDPKKLGKAPLPILNQPDVYV